MVEPYQALGLVPTMRGIRHRDEIGVNIEHLSHLIKAASWLSSLDLPVRLIAIPEGALQGFNDEVLDLDHEAFARECAIDVPGLSASVNTVLASLERQPGEFIEDPWVAERVTLVAEQQSRVAAAAHLLRYFPDERAGPAARDAGEISWLLYWAETPAGNPCWPDAAPAAAALMTACLDRFREWGVSREHAGGDLPVRGVYGVPEQWPHVRALYRQAGFTHTGHTEVIYLARVQDLPVLAGPPLAGLSVRRSVGINGCRLSAVLGQDVIGYIEVETFDQGERLRGRGEPPGQRAVLDRDQGA